MPEQFKVEGEMLASKVNDGLNVLRNAYRAADPENCDTFDELLMDYFGTAGFGCSMGYFVERLVQSSCVTTLLTQRHHDNAIQVVVRFMCLQPFARIG